MKERKRERGIYERVPGSGEWWIRYADVVGRIRREIAGSLADARNLLHLRKAKVLHGRKFPETLRQQAPAFAQIAAEALEYSERNKLSAKDDQKRMKLLLTWFGPGRADTLKPQEIERRLHSAAIERKWAPATFNRYKALLSLTYRIAIENGKLEHNPASRVRRRREDNGVVRYLRPEEERALQTVVEPKHPERWAQIVFAINTGLRTNEQRKLTWDAIHTDTTPPQVFLAKTKNGSMRHVPLNEAALAALQVAKANPQQGGHVFPRQHYRMWLEIALARAAIADFHWHCFRHTFASRLVMSGVDIRTVADLMGHRDLKMTMRYSHLAPEHKAAAVAKLSTVTTDTTTDTSPKTPPALPRRTNVIQFPQRAVNQ
jgi:integrase